MYQCIKPMRKSKFITVTNPWIGHIRIDIQTLIFIYPIRFIWIITTPSNFNLTLYRHLTHEYVRNSQKNEKKHKKENIYAKYINLFYKNEKL